MKHKVLYDIIIFTAIIGLILVAMYYTYSVDNSVASYLSALVMDILVVAEVVKVLKIKS